MLVIYSFSTTFYFYFLFVKYLPPPRHFGDCFSFVEREKNRNFSCKMIHLMDLFRAVPRITKRGFDHFGNLFFVIVYSVDLVGLFGPARPNHRRGRPGARAVQDGTGCRHA
jgi:hypothetical protein